MAELSPMMEQYFQIKEGHKDQILFFRLGDFYEMFYGDALLASKELELTLTGRDVGQEERAPMCGVPYHACETYIARLIAKGYKVAICEQTEDPAQAKGLVRRDVIRVVTPGTVIENSMLADDRNNYIVSIFLTDEGAGLCAADVSTGAVHLTALAASGVEEALVAELCRYSPREVLFNGPVLDCAAVTACVKERLSAAVELMDDGCYAPAAVEKTIAAHYDKAALKKPRGYAGYGALAALLFYLESTQQRGLERLGDIDFYSGHQYVRLSAVTRANLELTETMRGREKKGTLLWVLDRTETAMGRRLLRTFVEEPLVVARDINARLDAVEELFGAGVGRSELKEALSGVFDIERLMTRVIYGSALPREVVALAATCAKLPDIRRLLSSFSAPLLKGVAADCDPLDDIKQLIETAIDPDPPANMKEGGFIRAGYNPEVDELRETEHGGKGYLTALEVRLKEETGIKTLKIGFNKVYGYYIEVSRSFVDAVPASFVRKQTLVGGERYITEELKNYENKILGAGERLLTLERSLYADVLTAIAAQLGRIQRTAGAVALLDVLCALAEVAVHEGYTRPVVEDGDALLIEQGRHPVVEKLTRGDRFVPNDTTLDRGENRMLIITGPNMAGKSTYMRQTALICLMAQMGSFVPAKRANVGIVDSVFTRVGAQDDLAAGKSTFMVEMTEVAEILRDAGPKSLVILDEIGRGTSTYDGMSIARAVLERLANSVDGPACKTMFATHYHELTELEGLVPGVKNYNITAKKRGDSLIFLRRIVRGPADDSYGIEVAKLAGVDDEVISRAKEVLKELDTGDGGAAQLSFANAEIEQRSAPPAPVVEKLLAVDPETLTPLEALQLLYALRRMVQ